LPPSSEVIVVRRRSRARLPHREVDTADDFVAFGLRDSLPLEIARQLLKERAHRACCEKTPKIVASAIRHFDGTRYLLHAWCVEVAHGASDWAWCAIWQREYSIVRELTPCAPCTLGQRDAQRRDVRAAQAAGQTNGRASGEEWEP
jgi:hypothetical protein